MSKEIGGRETALEKKGSFLYDHLVWEGKAVQTQGGYESNTTGHLGLKSTGVGTDLKLGKSLTYSGKFGLKVAGYEITLGGHAGGGLQAGVDATLWDFKPHHKSEFLKVEVKPFIGDIGFDGISIKKVQPNKMEKGE